MARFAETWSREPGRGETCGRDPQRGRRGGSPEMLQSMAENLPDEGGEMPDEMVQQRAAPA